MTNRTDKTKNRWLEIPLDEATGKDGRRVVEMCFPTNMTHAEILRVLELTGWDSVLELTNSENPSKSRHGH